MIELLILIVVFVVLILVVVWGHFLRQHQKVAIVSNSERDDTNVSLYHEHKAEIENDFAKGRIDEENYQYLLSELDKSLLQDIEENKRVSQGDNVAAKPMAIFWPISLSLFVLVFSVAIYTKNGAYQQLAQPQQVQNQAPNAEQEQAMLDMQQLLDLTQKEPDNADAWFTLGQSFISLGNIEKALAAYDNVIRIEGDSAELYGAKAQAYYYQNDQKITQVVQSLIDQALALDPLEPSTNILLGMHNFINQQYSEAIRFWQPIVDAGRPNVNIAVLTEAIAEAKNRLNGTSSSPAQASSAATSGPQLKLQVELSDEIYQQLIQGEDKTVFIYAISANAENGRMPLAALKMNASDLPVTVILDDSRAMTPQAKLSDAQAVNIYAIVSNQGGAGIKSGDFKAELNNIAVSNTETLTLTIDSVVP